MGGWRNLAQRLKGMKAKAKSNSKALRSGWGGRLKQGWRQSEDALRYRDKFPVTLAHLRCLEDQGPDEAPRGYRMKRLEPEPQHD
jgi:hypothetical protein